MATKSLEDYPKNTMEDNALANEGNDKMPVVKEDQKTRFLVTVSVWAVVIFIGVPFWWYSTDLHRLPLAHDKIQKWSAKAPCYFTPEITVNMDSPFKEDLLQSARQKPGGSCLSIKSDTSNVYVVQQSLSDKITLQERSARIPIPDFKNYQIVENSLTTLLGVNRNESDPRAAQYSLKYKVVFSLLNEDSTESDFIADWDIEELLRAHVRPLLKSVSSIYEFDVETQIKYFAPLGVPLQETKNGRVLTADKLKAFVNSADWKISSPLSEHPVLHFLVFVPKPSNRPLLLGALDGTPGSSNSFLIPQWGGVVIHSPDLHSNLTHAFKSFSRQLSTLIGVPKYKGGIPHRWQLDVLLRRRLAEVSQDAVSTLSSLSELTTRLTNMRIEKEVQQSVVEALDNLELAAQVLSKEQSKALRYVALASQQARKAYFNPTMLPLLYFPDEHKYAVYTPLHAPIAVPLIVAALREWKAWKARRQKQKEEKAAKSE